MLFFFGKNTNKRDLWPSINILITLAFFFANLNGLGMSD